MIRYQVHLSAHPLFVTEDDGFCNAVHKIKILIYLSTKVKAIFFFNQTIKSILSQFIKAYMKMVKIQHVMTK